MAAFEEPNSQTAKPNAGADQTKGDPDNTLWARRQTRHILGLLF